MNHRNKLNGLRQRGVTLLEGLLVLAIAAGLAIAAYAVYRNASGDSKTTSQARGVIALATQINRLYAQDSAQYTNLTLANVIQSGIVPTDFTTTGTTAINNRWNGLITPAVGNQAGATPVNNFSITITNVPADSCARLAQALASGAYSLWVNGTTAGTNDVVPVGTNTFNAARAAVACAANTGTPATLTFVAL